MQLVLVQDVVTKAKIGVGRKLSGSVGEGEFNFIRETGKADW